jgi:photosystem II stability/assembly factor-like uncharacterized protein
MLRNSIFRTAVLFLLAIATWIAPSSAFGIDSPDSAGEPDKFSNWQYLGPSGGDVRTIAFDPRDKNKMYLSTLDGQIYISADGSRSWSLLANLNQPELQLDQLFVDSRDSRVIYTSGNRGWMKAGGFFKSTDGGLTFKESKELKTESIQAMTQSAFDPNVLLVGSTNGVWISKNSGDTWTKLASATAPINVDCLVMDPRNLTTIYAGTTWRPYKSTDGGNSWRLIKDGMIDDSDVFAITLDPRDPDHIVASACSGIYESHNAGERWAKIQGIPSQSRRTRDLMQHPTIPGTVYAATTEGFWMTSNGGKNWAMTTQRALEINSIAVHPDEPNRVFLGTNNYGVLVSYDGGKNFAPANGNFTSRFTYSITPDLQQPNRLYAITHNVGTGGGFFFYSNDSGQNWLQARSLEINRDKPFVVAQDPKAPDVMYLGTNTGIFRSADRGASWTKLAPPKPPAKAVARKGARKAVAVKPKVVVPPTAPSAPALLPVINDQVVVLEFLPGPAGALMAATATGLYRTTDPSKGWEQISFGSGLNERVMALYVNPDRPDTIWAGTATSGVVVSRDDGKTWAQGSDVIKSGIPVKSITSDPRRPDYIYVGTEQTFYVSRDNGLTWVRRGGNLPIGNYTSILINPANTDEIMIASALKDDGGIFMSTDAGNKWKRVDTKDMKLASRRFWTMTFDPRDPNRIFAGTHSSGIYRIERRTDVSVKPPEKAAEAPASSN